MEKMQAIILAGGKGTRLRPLTLDMPKPVVPLINRPLLMYQLDLLARIGFHELTLSLSYQPDRIKKIMNGLTGDFEINYVVEDEPLGTGGAVRYAYRADGGTIIVFNGDIINDLDLAKALEFHRSKGAGVTIVLTEVEDPTNYGLVDTDPDGRVRQFLEKPGWEEIDGRNINAGTYIIEPEYMELIPEGVHLSIEREFFPVLVERGEPFFAFNHRGYWIDIGTVPKYLKAHSDFFLREEGPQGDYSVVGDKLWWAKGAEVSDDIQCRGPVVVGSRSLIEPGAIFNSFCVIGKNCRIEKGAYLDGCVLWDGVTVGAGARLKNCVLGEDSRIGANARLGGLFALGRGGYLPDYSHYTEIKEDFETK